MQGKALSQENKVNKQMQQTSQMAEFLKEDRSSEIWMQKRLLPTGDWITLSRLGKMPAANREEWVGRAVQVPRTHSYSLWTYGHKGGGLNSFQVDRIFFRDIGTQMKLFVQDTESFGSNVTGIKQWIRKVYTMPLSSLGLGDTMYYKDRG